MGGRVTHDTQRGRIRLLEQLERDILTQRSGEIDQALALGFVAGVHGFFGLLGFGFGVR
jgi:hypothetical protein